MLFLIFRRQPAMVADIFFRPPPYHKNLPTALNSNLYNLCNYTDNNILWAITKNLHVAKSNLEANFEIIHKWFYESHMFLHPRKCHILIVKQDQPDKINLNGSEITSGNNAKLLACSVITINLWCLHKITMLESSTKIPRSFQNKQLP